MSKDSPQPTQDLASVVARVCRERGNEIEQLYAQQLLAEAQVAWPGPAKQQTTKWLTECFRGASLRPRVAHLSLDEVLHLTEDGALLVGSDSENLNPVVVLGADDKTLQLASQGAESTQSITIEQFAQLIGLSSEADPKKQDWVIVESLELSHEPAHDLHHDPIRRLVALLRPEWSDIWVVGVFAFFAGLLSLATPIAVEALVTMIAFGRLTQPLLVLSLLLFAFLAFAGMMKALQTFVVEIIQRRLFVRVAADFAYRFPRVTHQSLHGNYGPELANRFFDIVTLQKVVAQLLLDGVGIVLTTFIGMTVLAFYHPWLLGFDVLLLTAVVLGILVLGKGAISSCIDESKQKYRLAAWLEDILRCPTSFKAGGAAEFALDRANNITATYLDHRRKHFSVLFRQIIFIVSLQAIAGTVLLGFGGWLVIEGQLTLGQLVAAELIVATILSSLAKLGKHIEGFYDLVAAVDKLGHLIDLQIEPQDGLLAIQQGQGAQVHVTSVKHNHAPAWPSSGISLSIAPGERVALHSPDPSRKGDSILLDILYGISSPASGHIEIENSDPRDLRPDILRQAVALVRGQEIFSGSIAENVQLGRPTISIANVRDSLETVGLLEDVLRLPEGLDTKLNATAQPLSPNQQWLLMLARAIADNPRLLLIDCTLDALPDGPLAEVCQRLVSTDRNWTLVVATHRQQVADHFDRIIDLQQS